MQTLLNNKDSYFMDDPREGARLEKKVNAKQFAGKFLNRHLDCLPGGFVLEAGCGSGAFLDAVASNYSHLTVTGIDISEDRVNQANAKVAGLKNAKAVIASIYQLPFPDNHFDFIYSRFLFEYLQDPILAATELYRVCRPGGTLLLQDLDGQFTIYPETVPGLTEVLAALKHNTGFDPNAGRKLFSFGKAAGFSFAGAETELYHRVFGKIDDFNYDLWDLKLDIAVDYLKHLFGNEKAEKLKKEFLHTLKDEDTVIFSHLFSLTFEKPARK